MRNSALLKRDPDLAASILPASKVKEELSRRIEELSRRDRALAALIGGSKALLENKAFSESARSIFKRCLALVGATAGYVGLLNGDIMEANLVCFDSGDSACYVQRSQPMPIKGLHAEAFARNKPVYHNDFMNSDGAGHIPDGHMVLKNVMFAPLVLDGKAVGLLAMANKPADFDENDAKLAAGFGHLAAIALQKSRYAQIAEERAEKLEKTVLDLETTQAQLIQSEKMASLGQLAAGVAHEINNPTGFISSNLKTLLDYQTDLMRLLEQYQALKEAVKGGPDETPVNAAADMIARIEDFEREIDIDYLRHDIDDLIGECREGTDRIKKIVDDLKHFAHPGEDKIQDTDVNRELEATLNVVNNELKYKAKIIKELNPLPLISANPQQLNQVFVNILVNAAQAIETSGEIRVESQMVGGYVQIRISDTGCGIAKEHIDKIFDLFFTTKEVGKGTGLGMHIAYNIIKKHLGDIRVKSHVGQGTTFIISLPARPAEDPA
jgi:signal transduction histidine kinase